MYFKYPCGANVINLQVNCLFKEIAMLRYSRTVRAFSNIAAVILLLPASGDVLAQSSTATSALNLIENSVIEYSTDGGETYSQRPPIVGPRETARIMIRAAFDFDHPIYPSSAVSWPYAVLELSHGIIASYQTMSFALNGNTIETPLEGMTYRTFPAISAQLLKRGQNVLTGEITVRNRSRENSLTFAPHMSLVPLECRDLRFQTGPILGAFGRDYFSLTCRTNMPAQVSVFRIEDSAIPGERRRMELVIKSEMGLIHRFRVPRSRIRTEDKETYLVSAERDGHVVGNLVQPSAPYEGRLRFVAVGDSRTYPERWRSVAAAIAGSGADLFIHVGDMVASGVRDWEWDEQFWNPARSLLSRTPIYAVIGNHERSAPLFDELLYAPAEDGRARNWSQEMMGVLLIGIDGQQDWSAGSENVGWLEEVLSRSGAKFIFFFTHYPSWSSAGHGSLDEEGVPDERPVREGREVIMPLLEKYGATAFIAGHDHDYERSEPPGGVTVIITGGGGAPSYEKEEDAERQNPYSEVFASVLHYCLFEIEGETCTMKAFTPGGDIIDTRTWTARRPR